MSMKLSVSLPEEDIEFLDAYATAEGVPSRSAVIRRAVRLLRDAEVEAAYADAWDEWSSTPDAQLWDATAADSATGRT